MSRTSREGQTNHNKQETESSASCSKFRWDSRDIRWTGNTRGQNLSRKNFHSDGRGHCPDRRNWKDKSMGFKHDLDSSTARYAIET